MTTYDERASLSDLTTTAERVRRSVEGVIEGKPEVVRLSLTVLLAEGHLLIEDVPGVGKTMLAKALARSIDCSVRRIQFTPDLLPSDITGVSASTTSSGRDFEFKPGAIFAQIVIGDEINRASPKTQSALLESMEERQVTIDGQTYELPEPLHGGGHPEPGRDGGHLPAARGAARPLHGPGLHRLPQPGGRAGDARRARRRLPAGRPPAGGARPRDREAHRRGARGPRRRPGAAVRGGPGRRHPHPPGPAAGRLAARDAASAARARRRRRRSAAGTTRCRTTSRRWPCRCWRTGCCPPRRRS